MEALPLFEWEIMPNFRASKATGLAGGLGSIFYKILLHFQALPTD